MGRLGRMHGEFGEARYQMADQTAAETARAERLPARAVERFRTRAAAHQQEDATRKESLFLRFCDWVSTVMGEPPNIIFWLVLVVGWTLIFAFGVVGADSNFLPRWFTGTAYNFPLNLLTTVAELFIGFLVAAAANRSQRVLSTIIDGIRTVLDQVEAGVEAQKGLIQQNIDLTNEVHRLAAEVHAHICGPVPPSS
jgi:low affinity Fe/Cu permease